MVVRQVSFTIFFIFIMVLVVSAPSYAGPPSDPPTVPETCDGNFYNQMSNRAWMEGQREMEVAQRLILKPDSVLEYSCFNEILNVNTSANRIRTGADHNNKLVWPVLNTYLENNFEHTLGGGSYGNAAGGTCDAMFEIWEFLKCRNFDKGDFDPFLEVVTNAAGEPVVNNGVVQKRIPADKRRLPRRCNSPDRLDFWFAAANAANPAPKLDPTGEADIARIVTYSQLMDPTKCSQAIPVPTGLRLEQRWVEDVGGEPTSMSKQYDDAVCTAPGCYFDPGAGSTPRCR